MGSRQQQRRMRRKVQANRLYMLSVMSWVNQPTPPRNYCQIDRWVNLLPRWVKRKIQRFSLCLCMISASKTIYYCSKPPPVLPLLRQPTWIQSSLPFALLQTPAPLPLPEDTPASHTHPSHARAAPCRDSSAVWNTRTPALLSVPRFSNCLGSSQASRPGAVMYDLMLASGPLA